MIIAYVEEKKLSSPLCPGGEVMVVERCSCIFGGVAQSITIQVQNSNKRATFEVGLIAF